MTAPRRVLLVGNFDRARGQAYYYNTEQKLMRGLVRAGHLALAFSDRDEARARALLPSKALGVRAMRRALLATVRELRPHAILLFHVDLLDADAIAGLREAAPAGCRLARVCVDSLDHHAGPIESFRAHLPAVDAGFMTTGDPARLAAAFPGATPVHFLPAAVDPAAETARVFETPRETLAHDAIFLGTGRAGRTDQLAYLRATLPPDYRFHVGGRALETERFRGARFYETLATAAASPALPLDDRAATPRLYCSNRLAQLLGQGLLTFTHAPAGLSALYEDGVVEVAGREALAEAMVRFRDDDAARRRTAALGWRIARARTDAALVAAWALAVTLGETPPAVAWPAGPLNGPDRPPAPR
jgi:hypothetical protein